jgi:DNA-binding transcriptional LysR family regulator
LSTNGAPPSWPQADLREIHVFLTLAEELHFGRTAERLGITSSYVSQTIRTLEARVGGKLFDRTSRRVWLTPVGERLRDNLAGPYAQLERGLADAREVAVGVAGTLRIGIYARLSCGPHWLQITRAFKARHPDCEVELIDTKFDPNYLEILRAGGVDMFASRLPLSDPDFVVGPVLSREPRVLLVAKDDPLASREAVCLEDFADRVVSDAPALPREMLNAFIPPFSPSGRRLRRKDIRSFEDCLMLVAAGELVHPTVASFLQYYVHDGVVAVPIRDLPPSETALVWLSADRSQKVTVFAATAAEVLSTRDPALKPSATRAVRSTGVVA